MYMKKILLALLTLFVLTTGNTQIATVFTETYAGAGTGLPVTTNTTFTTSGTTASTTNWTFFNGGNAVNQGSIASGVFKLGTTGGNTSVSEAAFFPTSGYNAGFNTTLSSNPGPVTWTFNMRAEAAATGGTYNSASSGRYLATILCASNVDPTNAAATGYMVAQVSNTTYALWKFSAGVNTAGIGSMTQIGTVSSAAAASTNFLSFKVTYDPSGNMWSLYFRDDGASAFADPAAGTPTLQGTAFSDNTYTGTAMLSHGIFFRKSTANASLFAYDNFKITVTTPTNYYYGSSITTDVSNVNAWWTTADGTGLGTSGSHPTAMNDANSIFNIRNTTSAPTMTAAISLGSGSKFIVGGGSGTATFSLPSGANTLTGTLDVTSNGTLNNANASGTLPTYGTLNAASTVNYTGTGAQAIQAASYGNLSIGASSVATTTAISIAGNLTNANSFTASGLVTFNGTANQTVSGAGATTSFSTITVNNTGTFPGSCIVEVSSSAFTVSSGFLNTTTGLTAGILKLSGSYTLSTAFFSAAGYTINANSGLWLNNANVTATAQNGSPTLNGTLRITAGTFTVGTASGNSMASSVSTANLTVEGGTLNFASRISLTASGATFNMSGGTINVCTVANTSSTVASFGVTNTGSIFTMSGGIINMVNRNTAGTPFTDYQVGSSSPSITGGTLNIGTAATATNFNFLIQGPMPSLVVTNTTNNKTATLAAVSTVYGDVTINSGATLAAASLGLTVTGNATQTGNWSNSGTFTPGTQTVTFNGTGAQSITNAGAFSSVTINKASGIATLASSTSVAGTFLVSTGTLDASTFVISGAGAFTLSSGAGIITANTNAAGALTTSGANGSVQVGGTRTYNTGANYTFNGASAQVAGNGLTGAATLTISNSAGVTLSAATAVTTTLALSSGKLTLGGNNLTLTGASITGASSSNYIVTNAGSVLRSITSGGGTFAFPIGRSTAANVYTPLTITNTGGSTSIYTVSTGATTYSPSADGANAQWSIASSASTTSTLAFEWLTADAGGNLSPSPTSGVAYQYNGSSWDNRAGSTANTPNVTTVTGITNLTNPIWTVAKPASTTTTISTAGISGLATSPITANATNQGILGFSATLNTGTADFTDLVFSAGSGNFNSFSQLRLVTWSGTAGVYGNGSKTVVATVSSPSGSTATFTSFGATQTLSTSATYYYIEGDVASGVTGATTAVTPQFTNSNVTVSAGSVSGSATGSAYSFQAFAALDHFNLSTVSNPQIAGTAFSVTITAQDIYNNTVTSFVSTAAMTANAGSVSPATSNTFTAGVLTQSFSATQAGASRTITATASTKTGTSNSFTVDPGAVNNFLVEAAAGGAISAQTAGSSFNIKITARDANNNTLSTGVNAFTGTVDITSSGTLSAGSGITASFTAGVLSSHAVTITNTGSFTITATRTGNAETGTSASFTVNPAVLNNFLVEAAGGGSIGTQTAGSSFNIKVTARDQYNNVLSSGGNTFAGTVDITSTGIFSAGSGTTASFTAGVLSTHAVTISNTGSFTITATRTGNAETGSSNSFTVNAGALDHFAISTITSPQIAGTTFSATITAQDVNNNTVTSFTGTAAMTTNAGTITPSTSSAFTAGVLTESFYVTQAGASKTITATASGKTGTSNTFTLHPGAVNNFLVEEAGGGNIGTQVINVGFNIQVTARDQYNNTLSAGVNAFTGTVDITSTGTLSAGSGTTASFIAGVLSSHAVTISNTGTFIITATRTGNAETGNSNSFTVSGGAPTKLAITNTIGTQVAGTGFSVTVESQDAGGTPTPVIGDMTVDLSIASGTGSLVGTLSGVILDGTSSIVITGVKYNKAESGVSLSVVDNPATITPGTSNTFTVDPGAINNFLVEAAGGGAIGTQVAGTSFNVKVTARDQYNNILSTGTNTFTGTVDITSTGTLSAGSGVTASFTAGVLSSHAVTISNTGSFTITATRTGNAETGTSASFTVNPGVLDHFVVDATGGGSIGTQTAGSSFNIRITAKDANNNTLSTGGNTFTGTVDITSTGTLSAGSGTTASFTAGVLSTHAITITNTGSFTITATRTGNSETGTSASFTVNAGALDHFAINTISSPQIAGSTFSATITAQDVNNNTVTSFTSTAAMTTNAGTISPATSSAFTAGVLTESFYVTQAGVSKTITATASGKTGTSNTFTVHPGTINNFLVEAAGGGAIGTQTAGSSFNIQVTARDQYNNTLSAGTNTFTGTVDISSTGTLTAGSGTTAVFTAGVLSSHAVTITSSGSRTITATRTGNAEAGTSASFTVNAATASQLVITTISSQVAGTAFGVTVSSQDTYGNAANVTSNSNIDLTVATGTGSLSSGSTSGTILNGTNSITISGVVYNVAEAGVSLTATQSSGSPSLTAATSNTFTVTAAAPTVTTTAAGSITGISASSGGNVTSDGGASVTARGVVWSTSSNPTTGANLGITSDGTGTGSFSSSLTGLSTSTTYHIRAYATNSAGTSYGSDVSFTTSSTINYYNVLNTDITSTANWGINTDGTGTNPPNFTANGQLFNVTHNTGANMGGSLTVSGTGSKIIVGDGTTAATLTGNLAISAPSIDVNNNGTLLLQTTTIPTFGTLSSGSTIEYGGTAITQVVTATSYSNLTLSGSGSRTFSGTTNISGVFNPNTGFSASAGTIVLNGSASQNIPGGFSYSGLTISNADGKSTSGNLSVVGLLTATNSFTIATGNTLSFASTATISSVLGKTITVNGTFDDQLNNVAFNAGSGSMTVNGTYKKSGVSGASGSGITFTNVTFASGTSGGTLYVSAGGPRLTGSYAGNVIWDVTSSGLTGPILLGTGSTTTIGGNFRVISTGGGSNAIYFNNGSGARSLTVSGDISIEGGEMQLTGTGGTALCVLTTTNLTISGGNLLVTAGTGTGATMNIKGDLNHTSGTLGIGSGSGTISFNSSTVDQAINTTGISGNTAITIANTKTGGIVTLNSSFTASGTVSVTNGTFKIASSKTLTSSNTVTVSSGAVLGGTGTVAANITANGTVTGNQSGSGSIGTLSVTGNVSFTASTGIYQVDLNNTTGSAGTINDLLAITGNLTVGSTAKINLSGTISNFDNTQTYTWTIATVSGSVTTLSNFGFTSSNLSTILGTVSTSFSVSQVGNNIVLTYSPNNNKIIWSSAGGSAWLTNTNWTGSVVPTSTDIAQFDTNPTGTTAASGVGVNMNGATNNGSNNQVAAGIYVSSTRTSNLFVGNTSGIAAGTLTLSGGAISGVPVTISNQSSNTSTLTILNSTQSGSQALTLNLPSTAYILTGAGSTTTIGNTINITSITSGAASGITFKGGGSGSTNGGLLRLGAANTFVGGITVGNSDGTQYGILQLDALTALNNTSGNNVTVNSNSQLYLGITGTYTTGSITLNLNGNGNTVTTAYGAGALRAAASTTPIWTGPINLGSSSTIAADASATLTLSGIISGSSKQLTKAGAGTLALTATNTFDGGVVVSAGILQLNKTGGTTIPSTSNVTISGGTLKVSSNQTINNVSIASGATLLVDAGVTLTINGTYSCTSGTITNNGKIVINNAISFPGSTTTVSASFNDLETAANVTLDKDLAVSGTLTLTSGILAVGSNTLTLSSTVSATSGSISSSSTGTVNYAQSSNGQSVLAFNYGNLTFSNFNKTLAGSGTIGIAGIFTPGSGTATVTGSTINFNGSAQNIPAFSFNNLTASGAATKTMTGAVIVGAALNIATSSDKLSIASNTLTLNGTITGSGLLTGSAASNITIGGSGALGTLKFDQGNDTLTNALNNLSFNRTTSGTVSLGSKLIIKNTLTPSMGQLLTGDSLHLRSNSANTAIIADASGNTDNPSTYISGNVTVERYISAATNNGSSTTNRAYRLITPSVNTTTSINANWQEGKHNTDIATNIGADRAGYGTHITGTAGNAAGFDETQFNSNSLFTYTSTGPAWVPVTSTLTGASATMDAKTGYMLFVRGNRDNLNALQTSLGYSNTTLRATGTLPQGTQTFSSLPGAETFSLVTNPYASPIYWKTGTGGVYAGNNLTNFANSIAIWDPNIGSRGGFVSVTTTGDVGGATTNLTNQIQSGQAFFVQSAAGAGPFDFVLEESHKSTTNSLDVFRNGTQTEMLKTFLFYTNATGRHAADGVTSLFKTGYSAAVDGNDARQIDNWDEDVSISRGGRSLSIERRPLVDADDTIPLKVARLKVQAYEWEFQPSSFNAPDMQAYLVDGYLGTETAISLSATTVVPFTVTSNTATSAATRFSIVFKPVAITRWTGSSSTDFANAANWDNGLPGITKNASVPPVTNRPVLSTPLAINSITVDAGADITLAATINIRGSFVNNGTIKGTGTLVLNGTKAQSISGRGSMANLSISNSNGVAIEAGAANMQDITGTLTLMDGVLNTNSNLTLKSTSITNTATVAPIDGTTNKGSINGRVVVERFIPAGKRAFRFIAPGVTTISTIKANWQEGSIGATDDPNPGYGTHITGSTTDQANGFDATATGAPSLFLFDNATQSWNSNGIANTDNTTLNAGNAYRLMVRGNRSYNLAGAQLPTSTATVLRATGSLLTGQVKLKGSAAGATAGMPLLSPAADGYSFVGNPYVAALDWGMVSKTDITGYYYIWDPTLGTRGAYVSCFVDGTRSNASSAVTKDIQPGQAFFVQNNPSITTGPELTIEETHKSSGLTNVFRNANAPASISMQLFVAGNAGGISQDGALVLFGNGYSNAVDGDDATKMPNLDENMAIARGSRQMSIERRAMPSLDDTVHIKLWQLASRDYVLKLDANDLDPSMAAYIQDSYLGTETMLGLQGSTQVTFTANSSIAASMAANRFRILFRAPGALPVSITSIRAYQKNQGIQVEWATQQETNMQGHEVERSTDGLQFKKLGTVPALGNGTNSYGWFDASPVNGSNWYRIKSMEKSGKQSYSQVVKVNLGKTAITINAYPNPIIGNSFNLEMNNMDKGSYTIIITNKLGQELLRKQIDHTGGATTRTISIDQPMAIGTYQLMVVGKEINLLIPLIKQ
jgi:fibronectin-binding autotransporter adhesin